MKDLIIIACMWLIEAAFLYALMSFVAWDLNPGHTDGMLRFFVAILWSISALFSTALYKDLTA